jgi:glycosyltransferase involved in cell wall biosynthesis
MTLTERPAAATAAEAPERPASPLPGRVAWLTGEYPRATDTFIQREVAALRAAGVDIVTCSIRRTGTEHHVGPEQAAEAAATFHVLEASRAPLRLAASHLRALTGAPGRYLRALRLALATRQPGVMGFAYQMFYFAEAGVLAQHLARLEVRHLHNHFGNSSCSVAMLASAIGGIPFSYTMHGPAIFFEPGLWRIDEKIARAAFVSCISHFCRSQGMVFADPKHWERMHIVHCGVVPEMYGPRADAPEGAEQAGIAAGQGPRLLFVGRLAAVKGLPVLFEALKALVPRHPGLMLELIGDGSERAGLERRVAAAGLGDHVRFLGYRGQAEVADRLRETDVFVLPSFAEGVPVVLMEAMASRVPVVATRVAGVGELVRDGESGFTVPPGDPVALAAAIDALLADPALCARMGEAGRAHVAAEYDVRRESAWLLEILRAAMTGGPRPGLRPDADRTTAAAEVATG